MSLPARLACGPIASTSGRGVEPPAAARPAARLLQPRRAALSCGAGRRALVVAAAAAPGGGMSLQQRWRALKFSIQDQRAKLAQAPPVAAVAAAVAALRARLQPLYDLAAALAAWQESLNERYNQFLALETKTKWTWSKRNAKEIELLQAVPTYIFFLACTVLWQALTPVSFTLSLALPLYYSWVCWDRWWASPVLAGLVLMAPLKFAPWGLSVACWVWPGLI